MSKYLGFKSLCALLLLPSFYSAASIENSEVSLSLWADMAVSCQQINLQKNYRCQLSASKRTLYLGFESELKTEVTDGDVGEAIGKIFVSAGLMLPFLLLDDSWKTRSVENKVQKLLRSEVELVEHPPHLEIQTFVDGLQARTLKTDDLGMFNLDIKQDSVVSFYAVYDKRALVLQQDIYLK